MNGFLAQTISSLTASFVFDGSLHGDVIDFSMHVRGTCALLISAVRRLLNAPGPRWTRRVRGRLDFFIALNEPGLRLWWHSRY